MLPNESFLVVLQYADYKTLVAVQLTRKRFLRLVVKYAAELAWRRGFQVAVCDTRIVYEDVTIGAQRSVQYEPYSKKSLEAACREVGEAIGPHTLVSLIFHRNTWNMYGVGVIFEAAAPLKYANEVVLFSSGGATIWSHFETFMSNFVRLESLRLRLKGDVFHQFSWRFLRQESARELRRITVDDMSSTFGNSAASEKMQRSIEQLVRDCATLPRLRGEGSLKLDFSETDFPAAFGLRIIEVLKNCGREVTFRMMSLWNGEHLLLDGSDYTAVDADGTTTRYASDKSGIVVKVKGPWITIRSTADVPRKKRCLETSEEVLPMIPSLQQ